MTINKNVGTVDRIVRLILAMVFVALIVTNVVSGLPAIILGVLAAVFVVTSIFSFCPLYYLFRLSTAKQ